MRKRRGVFWIASAIGLFLVAIAAVGLSVWWGRFLRSDAFRNLISAKTGEALGAAVVYGPLRWTGSSIFSDSVQASGLPGRVIENLRADQVRADINWRAIFHGAWRVESIQAVSLEATFRPGSNAPAAGPGAPALPRHGIASLLPTRFEVGQVDVAQGHLLFRSAEGIEIASLRNSSLQLRPDGAGWRIDGSGGSLAISKAPALDVVTFRSRVQGDVFFLTDAQFRLGDTGRISASGEFSKDSKLRVEWSQVDVVPFLDPTWRSRLSGKWGGTAFLEWPESGITTGKATGTFRLTDGLAENIELLDRVAAFTGAPQFRRMSLQELSGNYEWTKGSLQITNLVAESKGLLRLEGSCVITDAGGITGALRVGVTPQTLQWIPGSRERVFTVAQNGYVWTDIKISGSLKDLREDLTPRLVAAMQDETIHQGTRIIRELPNAAREGAQGALDAWFR
jgi:hypothetical protein